MSIYAIGDLHLSSNEQKPMDIFGWINHKEKIFSSWNELVTDEDIVIIAGDTSWALKFEDAKLDLDEISRLRGRKIIIKGNHDYWWQSVHFTLVWADHRKTIRILNFCITIML